MSRTNVFIRTLVVNFGTVNTAVQTQIVWYEFFSAPFRTPNLESPLVGARGYDLFICSRYCLSLFEV